ncbi:hypothetical protein HanIR_Chr02g0097591 [Helianthus annuus]|nr:hypothetical protein HanIR_Chr02g0097591 [Helianthus annuus]
MLKRTPRCVKNSKIRYHGCVSFYLFFSLTMGNYIYLLMLKPSYIYIQPKT